MNDLPRQKLGELIRDYGRALCDDPRRCEAMLKDRCPEHKREITVLIGALKENVAAELLKNSGTLPIEALAPKLTQRLYDHLGMAEEFARWAVESWALALGLIAAPLPPTPRPSQEGKPTPAPQTSEVLETSEVLKQVTPGQNFTVDLGKGVKLEMVSIPGGTFTMGAPPNEEGRSNDERPQHRVTIQPFYIGKYPVTQAQWQAVMGNNPSKFEGPNRPVEKVSWDDVQEFIEKLNDLAKQKPSFSEKLGFSLPSEAQWEYACRAGAQTAYCFGDDPEQLDEYAWYWENSNGQTHPVGQKQPNAWGLYDMHGNVWEWCADPWHGNYNGASTDGSVWETGGDASRRLLRGGSWHNSYPAVLRCANRYNAFASARLNRYGLRVARGR